MSYREKSLRKRLIDRKQRRPDHYNFSRTSVLFVYKNNRRTKRTHKISDLYEFIAGMDHHNVPVGFPVIGGIPGYSNVVQGHQGTQDEVAVKALEALDDSTIRIVFMVPPIFVGLQARVELRYTSDKT